MIHIDAAAIFAYAFFAISPFRRFRFSHVAAIVFDFRCYFHAIAITFFCRRFIDAISHYLRIIFFSCQLFHYAYYVVFMLAFTRLFSLDVFRHYFVAMLRDVELMPAVACCRYAIAAAAMLIPEITDTTTVIVATDAMLPRCLFLLSGAQHDSAIDALIAAEVMPR